jgi:aspartyl/asparaginyl-tRNA synthetase
MTHNPDIELAKLDKYVDQQVSVSARIHNKRCGKKISFIVLRDNNRTIQGVYPKPADLVKYNQFIEIKRESIVRIIGKVVKVTTPIKATTFSHIELQINDFEVISESHKLPITVIDCSRKASEPLYVGQKERLDNRVLDLRTLQNHAIFRTRSLLINYMREYLLLDNFMEINTPKLLGSKSEGGSDVFTVNYFDGEAYLAQSPQLYKQMAINSGFHKVFEVGPIFRAEKSFTNRHLTEFTGFDIEMTFNDHYHEVIHILYNCLAYGIKKLSFNNRYDMNIVMDHNSTETPFIPTEPLILPYPTVIKLLNDSGKTKIGDSDDLSSKQEALLGEIIKEKHNTDLFVIDEYPLATRPFYTQHSNVRSGASHSYDFIFRGREILSGAQRVNDYEQLLENIDAYNYKCVKAGALEIESVKENEEMSDEDKDTEIKKIKVKIEKEQLNPNSLGGYLDSFKYGSYKHGGGGFGIDRIIQSLYGLDNIRKTSMFPRDPARLYP